MIAFVSMRAWRQIVVDFSQVDLSTKKQSQRGNASLPLAKNDSSQQNREEKSLKNALKEQAQNGLRSISFASFMFAPIFSHFLRGENKYLRISITFSFPTSSCSSFIVSPFFIATAANTARIAIAPMHLIGG
jgi:hypothetical protein